MLINVLVQQKTCFLNRVPLTVSYVHRVPTFSIMVRKFNAFLNVQEEPLKLRLVPSNSVYLAHAQIKLNLTRLA